MKIQFTPKELLPSLRLAFAGAETKDVQPVLTGVKITATKEAHLLLQAATKDTGIRIAANAHVAKEGTTAVPRAMLKVLESAPKTEMLTLETTKKSIVLSGKGVAHTEIPTFDDDDFPDIDEFPSSAYFQMPAKDMLSLIQRTIIAVNKNDPRPERTAIWFELDDLDLTAMGTDGHLLVWQTARGKSVSKNTRFSLTSPLHWSPIPVCFCE